MSDATGIGILLVVGGLWVALLVASVSALLSRQWGKGIGLALVWLLPVLIVAPLYPAVRDAKEKARRSACLNNLSALGKSMIMYSMDHMEAFPPDLASLKDSGANTPKVFICKSSGHSSGEFDQQPTAVLRNFGRRQTGGDSETGADTQGDEADWGVRAEVAQAVLRSYDGKEKEDVAQWYCAPTEDG